MCCCRYSMAKCRGSRGCTSVAAVSAASNAPSSSSSPGLSFPRCEGRVLHCAADDALFRGGEGRKQPHMDTDDAPPATIKLKRQANFLLRINETRAAGDQHSGAVCVPQKSRKAQTEKLYRPIAWCAHRRPSRRAELRFARRTRITTTAVALSRAHDL